MRVKSQIRKYFPICHCLEFFIHAFQSSLYQNTYVADVFLLYCTICIVYENVQITPVSKASVNKFLPSAVVETSLS